MNRREVSSGKQLHKSRFPNKARMDGSVDLAFDLPPIPELPLSNLPDRDGETTIPISPITNEPQSPLSSADELDDDEFLEVEEFPGVVEVLTTPSATEPGIVIPQQPEQQEPGQQRHRGIRILLTVLILLTLIFLIYLLFRPPSSTTPPTEPTIPTLPARWTEYNKYREALFDRYGSKSVPEGWYSIAVDHELGQSRFKAWDTDHDVLGDLANWMIEVMTFYRVSSPTPKVREAIEHWIRLYRAKFVKPHQQYPWGINWYNFSITVPLMLVYYLYTFDTEPRSSSLFNTTTDLIDEAADSPVLSLGWKRDGPNSIFIAAHWIGNAIWKSEAAFQTAAANSGYDYALSQCEFTLQSSLKNQGLYIDYGYIFHTDVVAYGYLTSPRADAKLLASVSPRAASGEENVATALELLGHPTIANGWLGFFGRGGNATRGGGALAKVYRKVFHAASIGAFALQSTTQRFTMRLQRSHISFYESDKSNSAWGQYWTQARILYPNNLYTSFNKKLNWPGLIWQDGQLSTIELESTGFANTQRWQPTMANSAVFKAQEDVYILYQRYSIPELVESEVVEVVVAQLIDDKLYVDICVQLTTNTVLSYNLTISPEESRPFIDDQPLTYSLSDPAPNLKLLTPTLFTINDISYKIVQQDGYIQLLADDNFVALFPETYTEFRTTINTSMGELSYDGFAFSFMSN